MITVILVTILLGSIWIVYNTGLKVFYSQGTRTTAKGEAGRFLVNISSELRQALSVTSAQAASVTFTIDSNNDGVNETIQYIWTTSGNPINRVATVTRAVVRSVTSLAFAYYDVNNNLLSFPVTASQVRRVNIDLTVTDKNETVHLRTNVTPRNI